MHNLCARNSAIINTHFVENQFENITLTARIPNIMLESICVPIGREMMWLDTHEDAGTFSSKPSEILFAVSPAGSTESRLL